MKRHQIDTAMYSYDETESILTINVNVEKENGNDSVPSPKRVRYEEIITKNENDDDDKCSYPWDKCKGNVKKIIINEKITQIPKRAFTNCPNLTIVELPETIASIEDEAFTNCYHLIDINIPMNCTIASNAFKNCFTLDVLKALNKLFCSINVSDRNIQHQIENIMSSLSRTYDDDYSEVFMNMKQLYNLLKSKENFFQLVKRFISLSMPLYYKIKKLDLQFNSFNSVINKDNVNTTSISSLIHYNDFRNNKCDDEFR